MTLTTADALVTSVDIHNLLLYINRVQSKKQASHLTNAFGRKIVKKAGIAID